MNRWQGIPRTRARVLTALSNGSGFRMLTRTLFSRIRSGRAFRLTDRIRRERFSRRRLPLPCHSRRPGFPFSECLILSRATPVHALVSIPRFGPRLSPWTDICRARHRGVTWRPKKTKGVRRAASAPPCDLTAGVAWVMKGFLPRVPQPIAGACVFYAHAYSSSYEGEPERCLGLSSIHRRQATAGTFQARPSTPRWGQAGRAERSR